ncbi:uncharacterized protein LACBIDRAFT_332305 [Laccaria bicolor S238N-H82]|uniref:Predicted protein n=1 Tax=Laccaria bicolor (strain S238N-H82 / ATCC MYA-4686) TaxID=486041 RepID=B0DSA0_LACBS|nr:uncharacterized protein LACBIDRAFT_332305 [Laccaria bicolor S238N-H82]EDR02510.1 predicted protein [Laccaria bicolor S238N-H82]|eukprot:XP_001886873.1 predicted protein [Laccaria bicolor S238N-H82]
MPLTRNYDDHVPDDVLKRVNEAPGNITRLRCLIDNIECRHVVDYAHVVSHADGKKNELMSSLECSWGIEPGTLNHNSHRNIFRHMRQVAIHRRVDDMEISSASAFKTYVYPYEDFPTIVSHVHPRFVIFNTGQKLDKFSKIKAFFKGNGDVDKRLKDVVKIYANWMKLNETHVKFKSTFAPSRVQPDRRKTLITSYAYAEPPEPPAPLIPVPRHFCTPPRSVISDTGGGVTYDTPEKREQRQTPIKAKEKVVAAAVCLLDNTNDVLEYAHVLPRKSDFATLTNLEYSWNMKFGTLNVNTHRNIFLPSTIQIYASRQQHIFPFPGFPTVTSHVHPRFVLFNAGSKIANGASAIDYEDNNTPGLESIVEKIDDIYTAWTTRRAPKEFDAAGLPYTPANDDYPDDRTTSRRAPRSVKRTRATTQLPADASPSKKQKSGGSQDCA